MSEGENLSGSEAQDVQLLASKLHEGELRPDEQRILSGMLESEPGSVVMSVTRQQVHVGPLPPPELLNQYDEKTRHTIVAMAEKEQCHVHEMQKLGLQGAVAKDRRGQFIGGLIAISGLVAAGAIAPYSATAAAIIGSIDLFGMVALFVAPRVLEKRREQSDRD